MFQDIGISKMLNEQFQAHIKDPEEPLGLDFSIQVLSSGCWPFQQSFTFALPQEVCNLSFGVPNAWANSNINFYSKSNDGT